MTPGVNFLQLLNSHRDYSFLIVGFIGQPQSPIRSLKLSHPSPFTASTASTIVTHFTW